MSDSAAGDAAFLGGDEIVNSARTIDYLNAGYGPPGLVVNGGCSCPIIRALAGCDGVSGDTPYVSPAADPAPWYDPAVPESADFAGFLPVEFSGMGSTYTRENFPRIGAGSVLGRQRANERLLTWRGYLFGRTCCATQFGLRWLISQLAGVPCGCDAEDLDILVCCPEAPTGITTCFGLPSVQFSTPCNGAEQAQKYDAFRTLKEVALFEGPTILSERKTGCRGNCGTANSVTGATPRCAAESCITEVEFSLVAGNPFLHGCPILACSMSWPVTGGTPCPAGSHTYGTGPPIVFQKAVQGQSCTNEDCPVAPDCADDPKCPRAKLPTIPEFQDSCTCDPLDFLEICCAVTDDMFGEFFEGVPVIRIYSGSQEMRQTKIKIIQNPIGLPCDQVDKQCGTCEEIVIRYIPPFSTIEFNGTNNRVTLFCPTQPGGDSAEHLVSSPFNFPTLRCMDYCICISTDGLFAPAADATVEVKITPRQM